MNQPVYLALGSNLGDRATHLKQAIWAFEPRVHVLRASPVYETAPWGYLDQPAFLNQVVEAETALSPNDLLAFLKQLEVNLGRQPNFRYGPRQIDLDILLYADWLVEEPDLVIPHPRLAERAFVLVPLAALAPTLRHPVLGQTIGELLAGVDASGVEEWKGE